MNQNEKSKTALFFIIHFKKMPFHKMLMTSHFLSRSTITYSFSLELYSYDNYIEGQILKKDDNFEYTLKDGLGTIFGKCFSFYTSKIRWLNWFSIVTLIMFISITSNI